MSLEVLLASDKEAVWSCGFMYLRPTRSQKSHLPPKSVSVHGLGVGKKRREGCEEEEEEEGAWRG